MTDHIDSEKLHEAVESLPILNGDAAVLEDRDILALLREAKTKLPHLDEELGDQAARILEEIEAELDLSDGEEALVGEDILRGIINLATKAGAAQALYDTGTTLREVQELRQQFSLPTTGEEFSES